MSLSFDIKDTHMRIIKMVTLSWWGRIQGFENQQAGLHGRNRAEGGSGLDISDDEVDHGDDKSWYTKCIIVLFSCLSG